MNKRNFIMAVLFVLAFFLFASVSDAVQQIETEKASKPPESGRYSPDIADRKGKQYWAGWITAAPSTMRQDGGDSFDVGTMIGFGGSMGFFPNHSLELQMAVDYYFAKGSYKNTFGDTVNVTPNPLSFNALFYLDLGPKNQLYFGGGLNYPLWVFTVAGTSGTINNEIGYQLISGFRFNNFFVIELGYMINNGSIDSLKNELSSLLIRFGIKDLP